MPPLPRTLAHLSFSSDFRDGKKPQALQNHLRSASFKNLGLSDDRRSIGQKRNISGTLNGHRQHALVLCTIPGNPARRNFTPFSCEIPENLYVFIIYGKAAVRTELAHFSSVVSLSEPASVSVCAAVFVKGSIISHLFHPHLPRLFPLN